MEIKIWNVCVVWIILTHSPSLIQSFKFPILRLSHSSRRTRYLSEQTIRTDNLLNMGKTIPEGITDKLASFISKQPVFFVGTAAEKGTVNVSPKSPGYSLQVLDAHTVAYADLSGSGAETIAHVLQNGRITILFVNLEPKTPPTLLRVYGKATIVPAATARATGLDSLFSDDVTNDNPGWRSVVVVKVDRVSSSCGFSMPEMVFQKYRNTLNEYTIKAEKANSRVVKFLMG